MIEEIFECQGVYSQAILVSMDADTQKLIEWLKQQAIHFRVVGRRFYFSSENDRLLFIIACSDGKIN